MEEENKNKTYRFLLGFKTALEIYRDVPEEDKREMEKIAEEVGEKMIKMVNELVEKAEDKERRIRTIAAIFLANASVMASLVKPKKPTIDDIIDLSITLTNKMIDDMRIPRDELVRLAKEAYVKLSDEIYKDKEGYV